MIYIMNTAIIPSDFEGIVKVKSIDVEEAKKILNTEKWVSAVGHKSTAELLSNLLGIVIPFNRITVQARIGDVFLCFQPRERLEEGRVYSREEIEKIPMVIKKLTFF